MFQEYQSLPMYLFQRENKNLFAFYLKKKNLLPIASRATILTTISEGSHSVTNASTAYFPKLRQMIAIWDGFSTRVLAQENRNAGGAPKASIK